VLVSFRGPTLRIKTRRLLTDVFGDSERFDKPATSSMNVLRDEPNFGFGMRDAVVAKPSAV
jgi:hypothetical protein